MKVGIIGCGHVGMAAASAIFQKGLASELVLLDHDHERAVGEAMDLKHAQSYVSRCMVRAGDYEDLRESDYLIICAGVSQKPGESRTDLLQRNVEVLKEIVLKIDSTAPDAIVIIATNPVDILTYFAQELSLRPHQKVIGTGTMLDTSRFRSIVGELYQIDPKSVHGYVVGEHGNSEVLLWSETRIGGQKILENKILGKRISDTEVTEITDSVVNAAYKIIDRKGYTSWAVGFVIAELLEILKRDQKTIVPLSVRVNGEFSISGTCLGLPCVVGKNGIEQILNIKASDKELKLLQKSGEKLASLVSQVKI
jgi:L-lactate dehydrogenase